MRKGRLHAQIYPTGRQRRRRGRSATRPAARVLTRDPVVAAKLPVPRRPRRPSCGSATPSGANLLRAGVGRGHGRPSTRTKIIVGKDAVIRTIQPCSVVLERLDALDGQTHLAVGDNAPAHPHESAAEEEHVPKPTTAAGLSSARAEPVSDPRAPTEEGLKSSSAAQPVLNSIPVTSGPSAPEEVPMLSSAARLSTAEPELKSVPSGHVVPAKKALRSSSAADLNISSKPVFKSQSSATDLCAPAQEGLKSGVEVGLSFGTHAKLVLKCPSDASGPNASENVSNSSSAAILSTAKPVLKSPPVASGPSLNAPEEEENVLKSNSAAGISSAHAEPVLKSQSVPCGLGVPPKRTLRSNSTSGPSTSSKPVLMSQISAADPSAPADNANSSSAASISAHAKPATDLPSVFLTPCDLPEKMRFVLQNLQNNRSANIASTSSGPMLKSQSSAAVPHAPAEADPKSQSDAVGLSTRTEAGLKYRSDAAGPSAPTKAELKSQSDAAGPSARTETELKSRSDAAGPSTLNKAMLKSQSDTASPSTLKAELKSRSDAAGPSTLKKAKLKSQSDTAGPSTLKKAKLKSQSDAAGRSTLNEAKLKSHWCAAAGPSARTETKLKSQSDTAVPSTLTKAVLKSSSAAGLKSQAKPVGPRKPDSAPVTSAKSAWNMRIVLSPAKTKPVSRVFDCLFCGRKFSNVGHLMRHVTSQHASKSQMSKCGFTHAAEAGASASKGKPPRDAAKTRPPDAERSKKSATATGSHAVKGACTSKDPRGHSVKGACTSKDPRGHSVKGVSTSKGPRGHSALLKTPYRCTDCTAKFSSSHSLKRHLICHLKKKKYKCARCDDEFGSFFELSLHRTKQHPNGICRCPKCGTLFSRAYALRTHMAKKHSPGPGPGAAGRKAPRERPASAPALAPTSQDETEGSLSLGHNEEVSGSSELQKKLSSIQVVTSDTETGSVTTAVFKSSQKTTMRCSKRSHRSASTCEQPSCKDGPSEVVNQDTRKRAPRLRATMSCE